MANYPTIISNEWLANRAAKDETRNVRIEMHGANNFRPFTCGGKTSKSYRFSYDPRSNCHVLNVPESVWMENNGWMPRDLLTKRPVGMPFIVLIEKRAVAAKEKPKALPKAKDAKTSTKTAEDAAMAVLA